MHHHSSFMSDYFAPAAIASGWPRQEWVEECERWDKRQKKFVPVTRQRTQFVLTWHSCRHRFARYCIDTLGLTAGELMALAAGRTRRWSGTGTAFDTLGVFEGPVLRELCPRSGQKWSIGSRLSWNGAYVTRNTHIEGFVMHRRLFALVTAGILAAPLAAAVPLAAEAAPSQTGLTARNVAVCPTPQNTLTARCHAIRHELVDRNGKPVSPNSSTPHGYTPTDLQGAYNLASASLNKGAGQTIAIVDAYDDPNAATDLAKYRSQFKLPALSTCVVSTNKVSSPSPSPIPCFVKVNQNGVAGSYPRANGGWAQEISLDLDMASAICPNCNILLVEASSASFTSLGHGREHRGEPQGGGDQQQLRLER